MKRMRFPFLSAFYPYPREVVGQLTLPQMYVPENNARANQRKMNDVIDKPNHQLLISWGLNSLPEVLGRVIAQNIIASAKART